MRATHARGALAHAGLCIVGCVIGCRTQPGAMADADASVGTTAAASSSVAAPLPSSAPSSPPPALPAVCAAVAEDVSAAFGEPFPLTPRQRPSPGPTVTLCSYGPSASRRILVIRIETLDRAGFDTEMTKLPSIEPRKGTGDSAYFQMRDVMHMSVATLYAFKGGTYVTLSYTGTGIDAVKAEASEKTVATKLLAKP